MVHLTGQKRQSQFFSLRNINALTHYYANLSGLGLCGPGLPRTRAKIRVRTYVDTTVAKAYDRNFLYWRGLDEEPPIFQALGGCYPARWDPKCRPPTAIENNMPSILYHHRLNLEMQLPLMHANTKLITTVREPLDLFHRTWLEIFFRSKLQSY